MKYVQRELREYVQCELPSAHDEIRKPQMLATMIHWSSSSSSVSEFEGFKSRSPAD